MMNVWSSNCHKYQNYSQKVNGDSSYECSRTLANTQNFINDYSVDKINKVENVPVFLSITIHSINNSS